MHCISLPEPRQNIALACPDLASARQWLSQQPAAQPRHMLAALLLQLEAVDAAGLPPERAGELLDFLRTAALPALASLEPRFLRKALPLPEEDRQCFEWVQQFHCRLGVAYLRLAQAQSAGELCRSLHRAAVALRMAQYAHIQAAQDLPPQLDALLLATLAEGERAGVMLSAIGDPDYPGLGESNLTGQLGWALMLRAVDPYRLSAAQLLVASRAFGRWRELAGFQTALDPDPKAVQIDLMMLCAMPLPDGASRWLNVRPVARKLRQRIEALKAGEAPESLKLGRELSSAACLRLLKTLDSSLRQRQRPASTGRAEIALSFGAEHAYAMFKDEYLNPPPVTEKRSTAISHQRMAIFGFDRQSQLPNAVKKLNIPEENWLALDGQVTRQPEADGTRRQSPCLIAARLSGTARLGFLSGLKTLADGSLSASLNWYQADIEAGSLPASPGAAANAARMPVFWLDSVETGSLIVPASLAVRENSVIDLQGLSTRQLVAGEVLERGVDFVRYAVKRP
jgi:hypothetical protein